MDAKFLGGQYANPIPADGVFDSDSAVLTKREMLAAMAMEGILANGQYEPPRRNRLHMMAVDAVAAADFLLAELAKEQP